MADDERYNPFEPKRIFSKTLTSNRHDIYISGAIKSAENYHEDFEIIRGMSPDDVCYIHINSFGGMVATAIQYIRCMQESAGNIVCSVEGQCCSAATFIFLAGDGFEITPHSEFMVHNYSSGNIGKGNELWERALHDKSWADNLLKDYYFGFMTDEEIDKTLEGKDYYFSPEEVMERCQKMIEIRTEEYEQSLDCECDKPQTLKDFTGTDEIVVTEDVSLVCNSLKQFEVYVHGYDCVGILDIPDGLMLDHYVGDDDFTERDLVKALYSALFNEQLKTRSTEFGIKKCQYKLLEAIKDACDKE